MPARSLAGLRGHMKYVSFTSRDFTGTVPFVCGAKKIKLFFIVSRALKELRTEILRSAVLNEKFCSRKPVSKILKQLRGDELIFHNGTKQYFRNSF